MLIEVFDPVLCCSTGVCGPQVDPALVQFASDLRWVQDNGGTVRRFNLGQNPQAFAQNDAVRSELKHFGQAALPMILVDGRVAVRGRYPGRSEMQAWLPAAGAAAPPAGTPGCCCGGGSC